MKAKLTNGQLTYYTEGSTIQIGENLVTNPNEDMLAQEGYKEVIYHVGNGGTYIDGDFIIIETPAPEPIPELTADEKREQAYENEPVIMWDGKLRTCDFIRGLIRTYELLADTEKVDQLIVLWLAGREEIKTKYPEPVIPEV